MKMIKAVVRNGRIEPEEPLEWPDGTVVQVLAPTDSDVEEGWDNSPEGIAKWLARYQSLEPLVLTEEEVTIIEGKTQEQKEWEEKHYEEYAAKLKKDWE